jgi:hypothetical protein
VTASRATGVEEEVARYYTRGLRFPRLVGKTADGTRIPGGPYTTIQAVGGLVVFLLAQVTRGLWGSGDLFRDFVITGAVTAGVVWGLKFVRAGGRSPGQIAAAVARLLIQPRTGRLNGRGLRIRGPHRAVLGLLVLAPGTPAQPPVAGKAEEALAADPEELLPTQSGAPSAQTPVPVPASIQFTGVARRLAAVAASTTAPAPNAGKDPR